ncbi:MAG: MMPL family transporter [Chloroflexi bacterium]|nr:MMPL family transporter [Chloroflexota bacterium]
MTLSPGSLASVSGRHPWWTLLGWVLVLVGAFALVSTLVADALDGEDGPTQILEFERARILVNERFGPLDESDEDAGPTGPDAGGRSTLTEFVLVTSDSALPGEAAFTARVAEFNDALNAAQTEAGVQVLVGNFGDYENEVSEDGTTLLATVQVFASEEDEIAVLTDVTEEFTKDGFEFFMLGDASVNRTFSELAESDLATGETIGIGIAIIILALVFGAVVAAFIPIILAIVAVFTAIGLTGIIGQFVELNEFVPNIITMMGLAVGIDYSLFILSRYREERAKGLDRQAAIDASGRTAGRAVFFSGVTVVLALLGMLLIPERTFQAFGVGAITVVFVAVLISMTLLPALIGILGDRVNSVRAPMLLTFGMFAIGIAILAFTVGLGPNVILVSFGVMLILTILTIARRFSSGRMSFGLGEPAGHASDTPGGFWNTITINVMKRPFVSMTAATVFLLVLAFFFLELEKGTSGISILPDSEPTKQAFNLLDDKFGFGNDAPVLVVIDGDIDSPAISSAIATLKGLLTADEGLHDPVVRSEPSVDLASLEAKIPGDPSNQISLTTIRRIRNDYIPQAFEGVPESAYNAYVGGDSAEVVDAVKITDEYMPIVFAAVLSLSFILLLFAFRSITVSIASIIMNLLSVGAAYGLVVLVFQKGFLIDLFGFEQVDQVEFWLPLFMFSILFGLSMDYHVFMLSRIKERYDETGDAAESVAFGLRTTASIITGAALIMVAVFGGFALGEIAFFQSMGFGLGAAVLLDATVVRSLLVPSVMRVLGDKAWYLPGWLNWLPNISIEGTMPAVKSDSVVGEAASVGADD